MPQQIFLTPFWKIIVHRKMDELETTDSNKITDLGACLPAAAHRLKIIYYYLLIENSDARTLTIGNK
jgi:hypothetical protein